MMTVPTIQMALVMSMNSLDTAAGMKEISFRPIKKVPTLRGKPVILFFHENSTRTRMSFDIAAKRLSAITLSFSRPVSEDGVMFGSVAKSDIIKNLQAADVRVHKDMVKLPASIKTIGNFEVEIAFKTGISAKVKLVVSAQSK